jgi:glyoxylase-like metal-dependent hydrolase (beta-lactamase superfamily II)
MFVRATLLRASTKPGRVLHGVRRFSQASEYYNRFDLQDCKKRLGALWDVAFDAKFTAIKEADGAISRQVFEREFINVALPKGDHVCVKDFFHKQSSTLTYVVFDKISKDGVIIDPAVDFIPNQSSVGLAPVEALVRYIMHEGIKIHAILDTHVHADHLSAAKFMKENCFPQASTCIGAGIRQVQEFYRLHPQVARSPYMTDGSQFDNLIDDGEKVTAGTLVLSAINTPGHTPSCVSYFCQGNLFTGDALFMPDFGTGRCDFPGGSAEDLFDSIYYRLYSLPDDTKVWVGHDYSPNGRQLAFQTTIGESKASNIHVASDTPRSQFLDFRKKRDSTLSPPALLMQSLQANVIGGADVPEDQRTCPRNDSNTMG